MSTERVYATDVMAAVFFFADSERIHGRLRLFFEFLVEASEALDPAVYRLMKNVVRYESALRVAVEDLARLRIIEKVRVHGLDVGHYILSETTATFLESRFLPLFSEAEIIGLKQLGKAFGKKFGYLKRKIIEIPLHARRS